VQHQKPSSWGGPQYAYNPNYNPNSNKQTNMSNMKQRTVATNGNMTSYFSRSRSTPDFSTRSSSGYQSRGSIMNVNGNNTWNDSLSTNSFADPDEMVNLMIIKI
jgi:hypothetical protein